MHRHAGRADRMTLGLESAGRVDRKPPILLRPAFRDRPRALPFAGQAHRLVFDQLRNGEAVVGFDEGQVAE
ncbi:hypothetical protein D3C83_281110 [compost metagenome]